MALVLATAGAALTANPQGGSLTGIILAICAALIYTGYILVGNGVMKKVNAIQSSAVIFAAAGLVFGAIIAVKGAHLPQNNSGWLALAAITVVSTIIPVATFLGGLKIIGASDASLLSTFEPVVTVILAALLLGETIQPVMLIGGGLILAAVILTALLEKKQTHVQITESIKT